MQQTFLVEVGTEELPPKSLRSLAESFATNFKYQLSKIKLMYGEVFWYASPRRLALKITDLASYQCDYEVEKRGPPITQSFDFSGKPTKEAEAWASGCGISVDQAEHLVTDKGEWLLYRAINKGHAAHTLLVDMVSSALNQLPIEKFMRWGNKEIEFVRPVHTLIMLLDDQLLEGEILGVRSARIIRGHRFMGESELRVDSAKQYPDILYERGKVIADYAKRKSLIKHQINNMAKKLGGTAKLSDSLLEEVTSLVEWPVVLNAKFEEKFLSVPVEALVYTMESNQKYFPIYDHLGNLMSSFIFVVNINSSSPEKIISGNEKVIRSRLLDAEFFFKTDCKKRLEEYLPQLEKVFFHTQLGTFREKISRLGALSGWIALNIGANVRYSSRASLLSKCDLMTNMVSEFSDIQGVIGMHYALRDGEVEDVALAIKEHYQPRFTNDVLPTNSVSASLALADKVDTLVGIFGVNQIPKGDKDPFALRRNALGVLRIIIEKGYDLDLLFLTKKARQLYGTKLSNKNVVQDVVEFMMKRFPAWYQAKGYSVDIIQAVLSRWPTRPTDFDARVKALTYFRTLVEAEALIIANKRVANILHKSKEKLNSSIIISALKQPEEVNLATRLFLLKDKLSPLFSNGQYKNALIELLSLCEVIDAFFNNVIVMDTDKIVRINRLTLLNQLRELFLQVADISLLK